MTTSILFFSRGRGWGHAIPDMEIARELAIVAPHLEVRFASYASGIEAFAAHGLAADDLELPEIAGFLPVFMKCVDLIRELAPDIVYSHEEFAAVAAARTCGIPALFISTWLPNSNTIGAEALAYADAVIIMEHSGVFPLPSSLTVQPYFVGPLLRNFSYARCDRERARRELDIPISATLISVVPGAFATEGRAPIANTVKGAFELFPGEKRLVWVAGREQEKVAKLLEGIDGARAISRAMPIEQLIVASDVLITKGTQGVTLDAAALGVPTISLSHGGNPIDDVLMARIASNIALNAMATDAFTLLDYLKLVLSHPEEYRLRTGYAQVNAAADVAKILSTETARIRKQ